eukprot:scaffold18218_cov24-Tisochrysis_lutea.AAC.2
MQFRGCHIFEGQTGARVVVNRVARGTHRAERAMVRGAQRVVARVFQGFRGGAGDVCESRGSRGGEGEKGGGSFCLWARGRPPAIAAASAAVATYALAQAALTATVVPAVSRAPHRRRERRGCGGREREGGRHGLLSLSLSRLSALSPPPHPTSLPDEKAARCEKVFPLSLSLSRSGRVLLRKSTRTFPLCFSCTFFLFTPPTSTTYLIFPCLRFPSLSRRQLSTLISSASSASLLSHSPFLRVRVRP